MHYERILRDPNGTIVPLGSVTYHFAPLIGVPGEPHVALVENEQHQLVFDRIPEGYRRYKGPFPQQTRVEPATIAALTTNTITITDPDAQTTATETDTGTDGAGDTDSADDGAGESVDGDGLEQKSDAELRAIFRDELQRNASAQAKPETMIAQIRAKREAKKG